MVPALLSFAAIAAFATAPRIPDAGETKYSAAPHADDSAQKKKSSSTSLSLESWRMAPPPPWDASAAELERKGDDLRMMKAPADALDYYRAALEKTPKQDRSALYNKCGISELQLSRFDDAQKDLVNAIKRNKKNAEAVNNLGVAYFFRRDYKKAIKTYQKAIELGPDSASFHSNLGRAFFAAKKYDDAAIEYGRALTLDPLRQRRDHRRQHCCVPVRGHAEPERASRTRACSPTCSPNCSPRTARRMSLWSTCAAPSMRATSAWIRSIANPSSPGSSRTSASSS